LVSLLDFKSCAAWHIDVLLAVPLVIILALLAARRLGWISLHPREIVFFVVCLGLAPLYFLAWWEPGTRVGTLLTGTTYFTFPATVLFVIGIVRLFRHRAGRAPCRPPRWPACSSWPSSGMDACMSCLTRASSSIRPLLPSAAEWSWLQ